MTPSSLGDTSLTCSRVVVAYQQRIEGGVETPYLFRTYKHLHKSAPGSKDRCFERNPDLAHDIPIWKVGRATSAAPSFFEPAKIDGLKYVDGGFGANNPGQEIYREVRRMNNNSKKAIGFFMSIGTGLNETSGRIIDRIGLPQYLNYLKYMKKCATDSEKTHEYLLEFIETPKTYYRLNVDGGIGGMKLDDWRTRSKLRREVGCVIGKLRSHQKKAPESAQEEQERAEGKEIDGSSASDDSRIPGWFRPRNKTLENISERTKVYLAQVEVQEWLDECAQYLVENRRARVKSDLQRWEKACYSTWYQCNRDLCPRAEKEYKRREELRAHFLDKHREDFKKDMDQALLEGAIESCKINVQ